MKQKYLNVILGAFALALVAAVFLAQKKPEPKGAPLTPLSVDALNKIAIQHPGAPEIDLEKKNGRWALTAPVQVSADPYEVRSLTDLAGVETHSVIDPKQVQLKDLGLDPPAYRIVLNDTALEFGGTEPLKYQRYVLSGGKIGLIDDPAGQALDADYSDLVSKRLLPEGADVSMIDVPGLSIAHSPSGPGWVTQPADAAASSDTVQKFVDAWREARATWNAATPAASEQNQSAKAAATESINVALKDGSVLHFVIISRTPQLVLERSDLKVRYTLPATDTDKLLALPPLKAQPPPASGPSAVPAVLPPAPPADQPGLNVGPPLPNKKKPSSTDSNTSGH